MKGKGSGLGSRPPKRKDCLLLQHLDRTLCHVLDAADRNLILDSERERIVKKRKLVLRSHLSIKLAGIWRSMAKLAGIWMSPPTSFGGR
jgi:hypothetical protein